MRTMYMWMMELELQFDAFLDSPYFPLSLAENRLAVFYNNDQLFGVCESVLASGSSRLSFSSIYSFYTAWLPIPKVRNRLLR